MSEISISHSNKLDCNAVNKQFHWGKAVLKLDTAGKVLERFVSIRQASMSVGVSSTCISKVCNGESYRHFSAGYGWVFESDYLKNTSIDSNYYIKKYEMIYYHKNPLLNLSNSDLNHLILDEGTLFEDETILLFDIKGNIVSTFERISGLAKYVNIKASKIYTYLNNPLKYRINSYVALYYRDYDIFKSQITENNLSVLPIFNSNNSIADYGVVQLTKQGMFVNEFECINEACAKTGIEKSKLVKYIKKQTCSRNFRWVEKNDYYRNINIYQNYYTHPLSNFSTIYQISKNGTVLNKFESIDDIIQTLEIQRKDILTCLRNPSTYKNDYRLVRLEDLSIY